MPSAAARFVCVTSPLDPPAVSVGQPHFLPPPMLIGVLLFDGLSWNASASASAACLEPAFCSATWSPPPPHLHESPACDWSADCVVWLMFPAAASASAALVWVTEPFEPRLPIRTLVLSLLGWIWVAFASASADWLLYACCPATWVPPPPPCDCVADWSVELALPASAPASARLVCLTGPSSPALSIRTDVLLFDGWICLAFASASAD